LQLPTQLNILEVAGVGLLAGMGLTVSIVIAKITLTSSSGLNEVRIGLFFAALFSGILGVLWLGVNSRFEG
jgi:NhaA family Na+:H+ antiporter